MENSNPKPQYTKIGRDISLEDYLNGTTDEHNGHGYAEYMEHRALKKQTYASIAEYMGVTAVTIRDSWIPAEPKVQG